MDRDDLSTEEKIDYIYRKTKKRETLATISFIFKWTFRLAILGYIYIFLFQILPSMKEDMINSIKPDPSKIGSSIVDSIDAESIKEGGSKALDAIKEKLYKEEKKEIDLSDF